MSLITRVEIYTLGDLRRATQGFDDVMEISVHASIHKYVEVRKGMGLTYYLAIQGSDCEQPAHV